MSEEYIQIPDPHQPRCPVILLVDTSESMQYGGKIDLINAFLEKFKENIKGIELADKIVEIAVIAFGSGVKVVHNFSRIDEFEPPKLIACGCSLMGEAISKAIDLLQSRKDIYKKREIDYFRPDIFLLAGSEPNDMEFGDTKWQASIRAVHDGEALNKFRLFTIIVQSQNTLLQEELYDKSGISELEDMKTVDIIKILEQISPPRRPPIKLENFKFDEIFSRGFEHLCSPPNNFLKVDVSIPSGWGQIVIEQKEEFQIEQYHQIIGASAIGPLHVKNGLPCQDACTFETFPSGIAVIAIADGLGSASKSDAGARIAVDAAVNKVKEVISNKTIEDIDLKVIAKEAVCFARNALEEKVVDLQCRFRDLACTFIVVLMYKDSVLVAHIGDGAVVTKTIEGLKLISGPGESEYANEVVPLTDKEWENALRITSETSGILGVMAFTDGCQRAALSKTQNSLTPFIGFCEPLFSFAKDIKDVKKAEEDIKELLLSKKICENSEDDKTLVIAILNKG